MNKWIIFDWLLAVAPVFLVAFALWLGNGRAPLHEILGDGQLFFFCTGLAAAAFGDLINLRSEALSSAENSMRDAFSSCFTALLFVVLIASCAYGIALRAPPGAKQRIAWSSLIFGISVSVLIGFMRYYFNTW